MKKHSHRQVLIFALLMQAAAAQLRAAQDPSRRELDAKFGEQLAQLADKCDELGLAVQAAATHRWLVPRSSNRQYLFEADTTDHHLPADDAPELVRLWHRKFLELRQAYAQDLYALAGKLAGQGEGTVAYQLLHEVLYHDPQHPEARRVLALGTPSSTRIARRPGTRAHPDFGWQRGRYWQVESEHYRITTNVSPDAGVELAEKLERFHAVWQQVFFRYWSADESLAERFRGGPARLAPRKKLAVVLFADRDEYVAQLQRYEPQIAMSLGYYMKGERTAFFYAGDASLEPTWYHEATHQLFQELGDAIDDVGETSNFWIVEGVAVYMESLVAHAGYATLGGVDAERMQYARVRALSGEFYLPLAQLVRLGREDLQRHADIRRIYTQAAGLTHFLMDGDDGQLRPALVDFITMLYRGRAEANSLAARCGIEPAALDAAYQQYLVVQDADLVELNPPHAVKNLALGRTAVTDAGIAHLADYTELQWLDLSFTGIKDRGLAQLANLTGLRRLNLEGTAITDASCELIGRFTQLEELDLSGTKITDAGVARLADLKQLRELWLTKTQVSDEILDQLRDLRQLEFLEVSQTKVTAAALAALQEKLPQLNRTANRSE